MKPKLILVVALSTILINLANPIKVNKRSSMGSLDEDNLTPYDFSLSDILN